MEIGIANVIADMKATQGVGHTIQFVRASGKQRGEIRTLAEATYGKGKVETKITTTSLSPRRNAIWKKDGTIPILELATGKLKTLKISHLRKYDGYLIKH
jgi:hypothetical protein